MAFGFHKSELIVKHKICFVKPLVSKLFQVTKNAILLTYSKFDTLKAEVLNSLTAKVLADECRLYRFLWPLF